MAKSYLSKVISWKTGLHADVVFEQYYERAKGLYPGHGGN
jgi:hypothetical protein